MEELFITINTEKLKVLTLINKKIYSLNGYKAISINNSWIKNEKYGLGNLTNDSNYNKIRLIDSIKTINRSISLNV